MFYRVAVTRRTRGWIQREALIAPRQRGEDERLLRLIKTSSDFDRLARARIFLDAFPHSALRPAVLLLFGDEAARAARKLSHDAARRLDPEQMKATGAPVSSYFLNYTDRPIAVGHSILVDSSSNNSFDGRVARADSRSNESEARSGKKGTVAGAGAEGRRQTAEEGWLSEAWPEKNEGNRVSYLSWLIMAVLSATSTYDRPRVPTVWRGTN